MSVPDKSASLPINHLIHESSPYLLQHAHNPVDWYPWGTEALTKAKQTDKPVFLSIGYAACHWCHVMERESFEDAEVAAILNEHFVNIKVDREQRPDLDQIYMSFTMALTGSGGWPMSVFLTPDLKPFFAGTYFPPVDGHGRPSFRHVITEIARAYREDKASLVESAESICNQLLQRVQADRPASILDSSLVARAANGLMSGFDPVYGGFGTQPKFPHALELSLLLRYYRRSGDLSFVNAARISLTNMARGGIYDQLGGGFARYSTDREWIVPHFEKMLYDNALLAAAYAEAWQITADPLYLHLIRETLDWMLREMKSPDGGFYSAIDADSEGEEGKYYVWSKSEIESILPADQAALFCRYYDISEHGNWKGRNILRLTADSDRLRQELGEETLGRILDEARRTVLEHRRRRVPPLTDDKVLSSWNGLALSAMCRGYQVTGDRRFLDAALDNARFTNSTLSQNGRLIHSYRTNPPSRVGYHSDGEFLEDYAYYTCGLIDLYESDPSRDNTAWLEFARRLARRAIELFQDEAGRWYLRPDGQSDLIIRPREDGDGSLPAPGSMMISALLRLHRHTEEAVFLTAAEKGLHALSGQISAHPSGMVSAVLSVDFYQADKIEIVIVGDGPERASMLTELYGKYLPNRVIAIGSGLQNDAVNLPPFRGRQTTDGIVRAYVCRNSFCCLPATTAAELKEQLGRL